MILCDVLTKRISYASRRHRNSRGQYSRDGYSGDYSRMHHVDYSRTGNPMMSHLEDMMSSAGTEREREMIRRWMAEMR